MRSDSAVMCPSLWATGISICEEWSVLFIVDIGFHPRSILIWSRYRSKIFSETSDDSKKLTRVKSFATGDYVVHSAWLGRVGRVFDVVTVLFDDGQEYEILVRDSEILVPVSPRYEDTPFQYYPGQHVEVNHQHVSGFVSWFCGTRKGSRDEADFLDDLQKTAENKLPLQIAPICSTEMQKDSGMRSQKMYMITKTKNKVDVLWKNGERYISPIENVEVNLPDMQSNVNGYKDECVEVRWDSGHVSKDVDNLTIELYIFISCPASMLSPALILSSNEEIFFANVIKGAPDQQKLLSHRKKKHVENNSNEDCTTNVLKSITLLFPQATFSLKSLKTTKSQEKKHVENNGNEDCTTNVLKSINLLFPQQTFGFLARYWKPIWFSRFNFAGSLKSLSTSF
ncbi:hypothetical protein OPV22_010086 [Ensete ventricosum]|uniref:UBE2O-like tandem tSH3-B domain-containing protein n=1 Tax=Ensete ventricosum TaxID=4639 RepID=A0AAV8RCB4_ENSVE|nr:hypothetical protein OPV22_010086 [Ensete ventricosum]